MEKAIVAQDLNFIANIRARAIATCSKADRTYYLDMARKRIECIRAERGAGVGMFDLPWNARKCFWPACN